MVKWKGLYIFMFFFSVMQYTFWDQMFGVLDEMGKKLPLLMDYSHKLDVYDCPMSLLLDVQFDVVLYFRIQPGN